MKKSNAVSIKVYDDGFGGSIIFSVPHKKGFLKELANASEEESGGDQVIRVGQTDKWSIPYHSKAIFWQVLKSYYKGHPLIVDGEPKGII